MKLFKLAQKFSLKMAQHALSDEMVKGVVKDYYNEAGVAPPTDIRIQYQKTPQETWHKALPQLSVIIWSNSYLEPPHDSSLQDRLHEAFDPNKEFYNFYVKFF